MLCIKRNRINRITSSYINRFSYRFNLPDFFNPNYFNVFRCHINITGINMSNLYLFSFRTLLFNRLTCKCNFYISIFTPAIIQSLQFACFILHKQLNIISQNRIRRSIFTSLLCRLFLNSLHNLLRNFRHLRHSSCRQNSFFCMKAHDYIAQSLAEIKFRMLPNLRHHHNDFLFFLNLRNNKPFYACICIRSSSFVIFYCFKAFPICSYMVNDIANLWFYGKC